VKASADELALLGGPSAFSEPLHVGRPNIGDRAAILDGIAEALDSRWLSNGGVKLQAFEARLSERLGGPHVVATCNGTLALQIALRALGVAGEVVLPSLTFVATAHAVAWERLVPVFADVEVKSLCMGPEQAEPLIGPGTGALLGVHLWGRGGDVPGLERLARHRELPLIFDAAHALGSTLDGRPLTSYGDAAILSFHATKIANAFEGGAIVTRDAELARQAASMRNFGFVDEDEVEGIGTNAKMSEAGAVMGLASLDAFDDFLAVSRRNYSAYAAALAEIPGIRLLTFDPPESANCHHIALDVDPAAAGLDRDALRATLVAENVLARRYFYPGCHRTAPYGGDAAPGLPITEAALARCLSLPTGTAVSTSDIASIGEIVRRAVASSAAIRHRLEG
jgi:dTDP-4-amino-4,6-dideoxy-D-glucose transaminase